VPGKNLSPEQNQRIREALKAIIDRGDFNQVTLSKKLGIRQPTLSSFLSGAQKGTGLHVAQWVASYLDVELDTLLDTSKELRGPKRSAQVMIQAKWGPEVADPNIADPDLAAALSDSPADRWKAHTVAVARTWANQGERHTKAEWLIRLDQIESTLDPVQTSIVDAARRKTSAKPLKRK
jgi:hypothetical protein